MTLKVKSQGHIQNVGQILKMDFVISGSIAMIGVGPWDAQVSLEILVAQPPGGWGIF